MINVGKKMRLSSEVLTSLSQKLQGKKTAELMSTHGWKNGPVVSAVTTVTQNVSTFLDLEKKNSGQKCPHKRRRHTGHRLYG